MSGQDVLPATRLVRITRKQFEAKDIASFELADAAGGSLPIFTAGAHIDVHLSDGISRQYSLCNQPGETRRYLIAVLRTPESRGGSSAMHALDVGDTVRISDPKNHFPLHSDAAHHVLIAGGVGITPILCMAEQLAQCGASFELHYCARTLDSAAFVATLGEERFAKRARLHLDDGDPSQRLEPSSLLGIPRGGHHVYVCGPNGFMDWVLGSARQARWPEERLHREYFAAAHRETESDAPFEIQIASTGRVIPVPANQSVTTTLAACGIAIPVSCQEGVCGTCVTRVLEGTPDHRDTYFTPEEIADGELFTPCCSRAKTPRLVLDL